MSSLSSLCPWGGQSFSSFFSAPLTKQVIKLSVKTDDEKEDVLTSGQKGIRIHELNTFSFQSK